MTRKITYAFARIVQGLQSHVELGNLDAKRDWGYAGDYVRAMHLILEQDKPEDYVIASGESHTVRDFVDEVAGFHGITLKWDGAAEAERGIDSKTGKILVKVNPEFYRPSEVHYLEGDATRAHEKLGWVPEYDFAGLVQMMAKSDFDLVKAESQIN